MKMLLTGVILLLTAVLYAQWRDWSPPTPTKMTVPSAPALPLSPALQLPPVPPQTAYAVIVERPLFLPERRPPPSVATDRADGQTPAVDASVLDNFDLSAIIIVGQARSAWVRKTRGPEIVRVRLGEQLEGWQVKEIAADSVVLAQQGQTKQLVLRDYNKAPPPIPPTRSATATRPPVPRPSPATRGAVPARTLPAATHQIDATDEKPVPPEPPKVPAFGPG